MFLSPFTIIEKKTEELIHLLEGCIRNARVQFYLSHNIKDMLCDNYLNLFLHKHSHRLSKSIYSYITHCIELKDTPNGHFEIPHYGASINTIM